jgi:SAM-dependent methyltransferase
MGLYTRYVLPRLTHLSMRKAQLRAYRGRVAGGARGRVLEIGFGSGLNPPYYGEGVEEIVGVEPSAGMLALAQPAVAASRHKVTLLARSADDLPLQDRSIDTVVVTWSLCSIADAGWALREARRVLRPGGQMRFVEHGLSPDAAVVLLEQQGAHEADDGRLIGKDRHHVGAPLDLAVEALQRIGGVASIHRYGQLPSIGRSRKACTRSSMSAHSRDTWLLEIPGRGARLRRHRFPEPRGEGLQVTSLT